MKILSEAKCGIYTCNHNFSEARGCTIAELLLSGVPVAGITWKGNDAICESVINNVTGYISLVTKKMSDNKIANNLAKSILKCISLDKKNIYKINQDKFDMNKILRRMIKDVNFYNKD